jgi:SH3-like domain-containing protein
VEIPAQGKCFERIHARRFGCGCRKHQIDATTDALDTPPLEVLEKGPEYYKVKDYRERTGWVHRALLSSKPGIVVTGDQANVRQGPGTNHTVIFLLAKGNSCRAISKEEKWIKVQTADGRQGWVAKFLTWGQ